MSDEEELRARIEAQIAARRAEAAPPKRERFGWRGKRGTNDGVELPREAAPDEFAPEPHYGWVPPENPPLQPRRMRPRDSTDPPAIGSSDTLEHGVSADEASSSGEPLVVEPARPWEQRRTRPAASIEDEREDRAPDERDETSVSGTAGGLHPARPWLSRRKPETPPTQPEPEQAPLTAAAPLSEAPAHPTRTRPEPRLLPSELPEPPAPDEQTWRARRRRAKAERVSDQEQQADQTQLAADAAARLHEDEQAAELQRVAERARLADEQRRAEEAGRAEDLRRAEQLRHAEQQRRSEEYARADELLRAEEDARAAEAAQLAAQRSQADRERAAAVQAAEDEAQAEQQRAADEQAQAEQERAAAVQAAAAEERERLSRRDRRRLRQGTAVPEQAPTPARDSVDVGIVLDEVAAYRAELDRLRQQIADLSDELGTMSEDEPVEPEPDSGPAESGPAESEPAESEPAKSGPPASAASGFEPARLWRQGSAGFEPSASRDDASAMSGIGKRSSTSPAGRSGQPQADAATTEESSGESDDDDQGDAGRSAQLASGTDLAHRLTEAVSRPSSDEYDRSRGEHYDEPDEARGPVRRAFRRASDPASEPGARSGDEEDDQEGSEPVTLVKDAAPQALPPGTDLARRLAEASGRPAEDIADHAGGEAALSEGDASAAEGGPLRRAIGWLFAPAPDSEAEPDEATAPTESAAAPDVAGQLDSLVPTQSKPLRFAAPPVPEPEVVEPEVPEPEVPEPEVPEPEVPEPEVTEAIAHVETAATGATELLPPAESPAEPGPGSDLARRLASANALALARAEVGAPLTENRFEDGAHATATLARPDVELRTIPSSRAGRAADSFGGGGRPARRPSAPSRYRRIWRLLIALVLVIAAALALRTYVVAPYFIPSASMETTLHGCSGCDNDHVLVNKLSYHLHSIHRGDVVVFRRPASWNVPDKVLIKRVIGLPGDVLATRGGVVYVNGLPLDEPYLNDACAVGTQNLRSATVPAKDVFVMGDNRCESADSRAFGAVAESAVIGRAFIIIWPLGRIHWL